MAATQHLQGPRPLPRSESLQKMLDLEKQFKLARLQAQTSPTLVSTTPQPVQAVPIHPRRRDSRESLFLHSQQNCSSTPASVRQTGPVSPLSITIPRPTDSTDKTSIEKATPRVTTADSKAENDSGGGSDDNNGDNNGDNNDDNNGDDAKSAQSSICQSPSWEGYGQKKKDKKKKQEAEQQKRDRVKASQDLAKRRTINRLFKTPPTATESTGSSSASTGLARSSADTKSGRTTPLGQGSRIPYVWSAAMGSGLGGPKVRPSHSRSASAIGTGTDKTETKTRESVNGNGNGNGKRKGKGDSGAGREKAYPPLSSRSHALRASLLPVHTRQMSASSLSAIPVLCDDHTKTPKDQYLYATKNLSDQSVDYSAEPMTRGRQSAEPLPTPSGSYVRQARAQSIERSINGFMQEAALSDPNLLNAPNRMAFSYMGPSPSTDKHRPSSSQSKLAFGGEQKQKQKQNENGDTRKDADKTGTSTLETNANVPRPLDLATPPSGILSSIKSRISRRGSMSSGSTSNAGKSFKERAMGAMHLQSTVPNPAETPSPLLSRKPSQKSSQTSSGASAGLSVQPEPEREAVVEKEKKPATAADTPATTEKSTSQIPTLHKETRRFLPKAARVLGEINQQTMSQGTLSCSRPSEGSSTSSCREDSSVPPSPASTPDTSRPQSTKGRSAATEARSGSTETLAADKENRDSLSEGLGILDEAWSQSTVAPDNDAQSFVTTLTNQKSATSLRSQAGILRLKEAALAADHGSLGTHPALRDDDGQKTTTPDRSSPSAVYLQEARRSAPMVSSPLSKVVRAAKTMPRRPLGTSPQHRDNARAGLPPPPPEPEPERTLQLAPTAPMAKMLVECCRCKFFHDMPSRVYECMAQPDAVVTDRVLGVSGAITTMVKCPWCSHNMSTQCCAGYAAVVYLKERLH